MSQEKLGSLVGVGRSAVAMWECGKSEPDNDTLIRLSEIFGVSIDYLLGHTEEKEKPTPVSEDGLNAEQLELVSLYKAASPALRSAALAVLRAHEGQDKAQGGVSKDE